MFPSRAEVLDQLHQLEATFHPDANSLGTSTTVSHVLPKRPEGL